MPTRQRRAMGSAIGKHCSSSSYPLAMEIFSGRVKGRDISFRKRDIPPFPALPARCREQKARLQTQAGLSYHLLEKAAIS